MVWIVSKQEYAAPSVLSLAIVLMAGVFVVAFALMFVIKQKAGPNAPYELNPNAFILYAVVVLALLGSTLGATQAVNLRSRIAETDSVIWLSDMSSISGRVIRLIDRGAIVGISDGEGARFLFIPKDQIKRVDVGSPKRMQTKQP